MASDQISDDCVRGSRFYNYSLKPVTVHIGIYIIPYANSILTYASANRLPISKEQIIDLLLINQYDINKIAQYANFDSLYLLIQLILESRATIGRHWMKFCAYNLNYNISDGCFTINIGKASGEVREAYYEDPHVSIGFGLIYYSGKLDKYIYASSNGFIYDIENKIINGVQQRIPNWSKKREDQHGLKMEFWLTDFFGDSNANVKIVIKRRQAGSKIILKYLDNNEIFTWGSPRVLFEDTIQEGCDMQIVTCNMSAYVEYKSKTNRMGKISANDTIMGLIDAHANITTNDYYAIEPDEH